MKKILLASTILVGTAGFAAADVSFSGSAYMGVGYNLDTTTFAPVVDASVTASMTTTTDGGLEAGASIVIGTPGMSWETDYTEGAFGTWSTNGMSVDDASAYLSGDWGKLTVAYDANGTADTAAVTEPDVTFTYSNTWGDFGMSAYYTWAGDLDGNTFVGLSNGDLGATASYSFGDYSVTAAYDYDAVDGTFPGASHNISLSGDATFSGFNVNAEVDYDVTNNAYGWNAGVGYATGPYSIGATIAMDDFGTPGVYGDDGYDYGVTGSYDMGGGVSIDAAYNHDFTTGFDLITAGVSMAF